MPRWMELWSAVEGIPVPPAVGAALVELVNLCASMDAELNPVKESESPVP